MIDMFDALGLSNPAKFKFSEMTDHQRGALLRAEMNGGVIEVFSVGEWRVKGHSELGFWVADAIYRKKPFVEATQTHPIQMAVFENHGPVISSTGGQIDDAWTDWNITINTVDGKPVSATLEKLQ